MAKTLSSNSRRASRARSVPQLRAHRTVHPAQAPPSTLSGVRAGCSDAGGRTSSCAWRRDAPGPRLAVPPGCELGALLDPEPLHLGPQVSEFWIILHCEAREQQRQPPTVAPFAPFHSHRLGGSSESSVFQGLDLHSRRDVALKLFDLTGARAVVRQSAMAEAAVHAAAGEP